MIEIRGQCNTALCYCDTMDESARQQIQDLDDIQQVIEYIMALTLIVILLLIDLYLVTDLF